MLVTKDRLTAEPRPADNDVVVAVRIRQRRAESAFVYVQNAGIRSHSCRFPTREEAIAYALPRAKGQHVCAWLTDNWFDFEILEDFRDVARV